METRFTAVHRKQFFVYQNCLRILWKNLDNLSTLSTGIVPLIPSQMQICTRSHGRWFDSLGGPSQHIRLSTKFCPELVLRIRCVLMSFCAVGISPYVFKPGFHIPAHRYL